MSYFIAAPKNSDTELAGLPQHPVQRNERENREVDLKKVIISAVGRGSLAAWIALVAASAQQPTVLVETFVIPELTPARAEQLARAFVAKNAAKFPLALAIWVKTSRDAVLYAPQLQVTWGDTSIVSSDDFATKLHGESGQGFSECARVILIDGSALFSYRFRVFNVVRERVKSGDPWLVEKVLAGRSDPTHIRVGDRSYRTLSFGDYDVNSPADRRTLTVYVKLDGPSAPRCADAKVLLEKFSRLSGVRECQVLIRKDIWSDRYSFPTIYAFEPITSGTAYWYDAFPVMRAPLPREFYRAFELGASHRAGRPLSCDVSPPCR